MGHIEMETHKDGDTWRQGYIETGTHRQTSREHRETSTGIGRWGHIEMGIFRARDTVHKPPWDTREMGTEIHRWGCKETGTDIERWACRQTGTDIQRRACRETATDTERQ